MYLWQKFTDRQLKFANLYSFMVLGILEAWANFDDPFIKERFLRWRELGYIVTCV